MKKHTEEAFYERMRNLADVNKTSVKESQNRTLGTLIDYKRAADGVAYGIVKESHNYYIKKAGTKADPNVSDFAYIGGLSNITEFQYKKLSEADKQRNMIFQSINEASVKVSKTGSKKKLLSEAVDKAGKEIDASAEMAAGLDAAADADKMPEPTPDLDSVGLGGDTADLGGDVPPAEGPTGGPDGGGDELPVADLGDGGAEDTGMPTDELPVDDTEGGADAGGGEEQKDEATREIEKSLGKLTNTLRKTELTDPQIKNYVNTFLSAFKDKFPDVDIEDRKEMAEKITKVVPDEEIAGLSDSMPPEEKETGMDEEQCSECGSFAQYAESRGYNAQSIRECGEEEVGNLVSGYANAHNDGENDGDLENVALVIKIVNPEILNQLKGDYGHEDYASKLQPHVDSMNESSEEDNIAKLNELFGGLSKLGGAAMKGIGNAAAGAWNAGVEKTNQVGQAIKQGAQQVSQTYHAGEVSGEVKALEKKANDLGQQVAALNARLTKAGQQPINVNSILTTIKNQLSKGGTASLAGKIQEEEEPKGDDVEKVDDVEGLEGIGIEDAGETGGEESTETKPEISFAPEAQSLGASMVKPDGAPTTGLDINISPDKTVNISMNESEIKVRKYIRARLEEMAGIRKPMLSETKKSETLKKLDRTIEKQYKLFESIAKKKK